VGVVCAAGSGALVDVVRPGMPVAGAVSEHGDVAAQALVAGPAEHCGLTLSGLDRDGALAGVGGERVVCGVAGAVVADLGEQPSGGDGALWVAEEGEEDLPVWMGSDLAGDLACELADLFDDGLERGDESQHGAATSVCLQFAGDRLGCASELAQQFGGGASTAVGMVREEAPKALLSKAARVGRAGVTLEIPEWACTFSARVGVLYEERLRRAGRTETPGQFLLKKLLLCFAVPFVPLLPYSVAVQRAPSMPVVLVLAAAGFVLPDLVLGSEAGRQHEALFLDLPEAVSVMTLSLRAGQSLRQALELAARDCEGPLGDELTRALSLARRDRTLDERQALVSVAKSTGEPALLRFAELLAAKESPYVEFLRAQAREMRAEQNRYLERAADRAYLSMHAPLIPLLAVLVLLVSYGFFHFLTQTI
jgi:tight adherence protein C